MKAARWTSSASVPNNKTIETICAFANTDGGIVAMGVADPKELKPGAKRETLLFGIEENPESFDDLRRLVMQRFAPPIAVLHWLRLP